MPVTDPKRLLEAAVETKKIKLNFGRISKGTVQSMARQSLYIDRQRTPEGSEMPDPVEKVGKMNRVGSPKRGPVTL